jgi:hypothetical protein
LIVASGVTVPGDTYIIAYFLVNAGDYVPPPIVEKTPFTLALPDYSYIRRVGYTAEGWEGASEGEVISANRAIRLKWRANQYTFTLYLNGEVLTAMSCGYDGAYTVPVIIAGNAIIEYEADGKTYPSGVIGYYRWASDMSAVCTGGLLSTIVFDLAGGSGLVPASIDGSAGMEAAIPLPDPNEIIRSGYLPVAWQIGEDFLPPVINDAPNYTIIRSGVALCRWVLDKSPAEFFVVLVRKNGFSVSYHAPQEIYTPAVERSSRWVYSITGAVIVSEGDGYAVGDCISLLRGRALVTVAALSCGIKIAELIYPDAEYGSNPAGTFSVPGGVGGEITIQAVAAAGKYKVSSLIVTAPGGGYVQGFEAVVNGVLIRIADIVRGISGLDFDGYGKEMYYQPNSPLSGVNQSGTGSGAEFNIAMAKDRRLVTSAFAVESNVVLFEAP